ncbi:hypothetical protein GIB67_030931 [Kingdonia uniflora]|uniref:Uncharacterized protein n=1 Tax=Kingdonia uniflora TaxID=39325 RepID=A0A7J7L3K8_9MAGN|nr:hypothetical protein GIB67_030931 [Kingdonia uniflora]
MEGGGKNMLKIERSRNDGKVVLSKRWEYNNVVRGKLDSSADSHPDTEGVKSILERKETFLDEVSEEETKLEIFLGELGLSKKKIVKSRSKKVVKAHSTSSAQSNLTTSKIAQKFSKSEIKKALSTSGTTVSGGVAQGKRRRVKSLRDLGEKVDEGRSASMDDLKEVAHLVKGIWLGIEEQESELTKAKSELEKNLARAKMEALKQVRLGHHLMLMGYSQEEVDTIKADTCVEEEEEEAEVLGVMDGLDGVSPQTVLDNQGDDVKLPEGGSKKVASEMSLRINDLESRLATKRETSKALLSVRAGLQAKLDASRARGYHALICNQEFVGQFDRIKEANENIVDQYVKVYDDLNGRVARLKAKRDQAIACTKKTEAKERSGGSRTVVKAPLVQGDIVSLSDHIRELKSDISRIQEHEMRI